MRRRREVVMRLLMELVEEQTYIRIKAGNS